MEIVLVLFGVSKYNRGRKETLNQSQGGHDE